METIQTSIRAGSTVKEIYKQIQNLKQLIVNGISGSLKPIQEYYKRLYQDIAAIINGCVYTFSNGLLEGQVNRLKTIKRMMYGRGSAELLRIRVLYTHYTKIIISLKFIHHM